MAERYVSNNEFTIFVGTISYRLSNRQFSDFVRNGATSNDLPFFVERLGALQSRLEDIRPHDLSLFPNKRVSDESSQWVNLHLERLTVTSVRYEEGSVLAKIQVGAVLIATATSFLADYPDAKVGFGHLRDDVVALSREIFTPEQPPRGADGAPIPPTQRDPHEEINFYFSRPERFEDSIRKELDKTANKHVS